MKHDLMIDPYIVARAYWFYTISSLFFSNANSTILFGWLALVDNVSVVGNYDWGLQYWHVFAMSLTYVVASNEEYGLFLALY